MIAAVIPALNEEKNIGLVLHKIALLPIDIIIPVVNGCTDKTWQIVCRFAKEAKKTHQVVPVFFDEPLGIDVPRAIGAKKALDLGARGVIFVDGDMRGTIDLGVGEIIHNLKFNQVDLALTDCYASIDIDEITDPLANLVISHRKMLNKTLNYYDSIGIASPSHGPHGLSREFLEIVGCQPLAIPPQLLTFARKYEKNVQIATDIPHHQLGSCIKDYIHAYNIAQTIVGDCLEALALYQDLPLTRSSGKTEFLGYHPQRRWDLLNNYLK